MSDRSPLLLLVDSRLEALHALSGLAAQAKLGLVQVDSVPEAARAARAGNVAVILLGADLAADSLAEAVSALAKVGSETGASVLVVGSTASSAADVAASYAAGAVDFLTPPFPDGALETKLDLLRRLWLHSNKEKEAEGRRRALLESMPDGYLTLDRDCICTYMNPEAERLLARAPEEVIGQHLLAIFQVPERPKQQLEDALRRHTAVELEVHDETEGRWLELRACPIEKGHSLFCREISERKYAEEDAHRSQAELMDFLEQATEGLHWVGPDGTILWANQAELDLLGYTREEYVGRSITEFHADTEVIGDILCRLKSGEELHNYEARLRTKEGSLRHVLINSNVLWLEGEFIHTRCFTRDITEWKRAQEEVQVTENRFIHFMENLPGLAWMKDLAGRYVYVNLATCHVFGRDAALIRGKRDQDFFGPHTAARFEENDRQALESDSGVLVVEELEQEDGELHHYIVSKFPLTDHKGQVTGIGGIAIDITAQVRAEEALRAADRRKDEFLAMLAHELRNPLAPMLTAVEILRLRGGQDPLLKKQRDVITRQVEQMKRLLDDLLDVARITRGKVELVRRRLDLAGLLVEAVEMSRPLIDDRRHTLHLSVPEEALPVYADPVRLTQVFTNLLNNAARYTDPIGTLWLDAVRSGDEVRVSVRDTGHGMSPQTIAEAFELFAQGDRELARSQGGLGIGLTLVRELIGRHGGSVSAHSEGIGRGSEFLITLPLADAGAEEPPAEPSEHRPTGSTRRSNHLPGCTVLVVDDNVDQAESLAEFLRLQGYDVCVAHDGERALAEARQHRPALAILDIGLPGMDGYELSRRLREEPGQPPIALIAVTGYGRPQDHAASSDFGFDRHLVKPLGMSELLAIMEELGPFPPGRSGLP